MHAWAGYIINHNVVPSACDILNVGKDYPAAPHFSYTVPRPGTCAVTLQTTYPAHENDVTLMTATGQAAVLDFIHPSYPSKLFLLEKLSIEEKLQYVVASQIGGRPPN